MATLGDQRERREGLTHLAQIAAILFIVFTFAGLFGGYTLIDSIVANAVWLLILFSVGAGIIIFKTR